MQKNELYGLNAFQVWDTQIAFEQLCEAGQAETKRTAERILHKLNILPTDLTPELLRDELGRPTIPAVVTHRIQESRRQRTLVLFTQLFPLPSGQACLHANDSRGARYWVPLKGNDTSPENISDALRMLQEHVSRPIVIFPSCNLTATCRKLTSSENVKVNLIGYRSVLDLDLQHKQAHHKRKTMPHLERLEAESIHTIREAVAEAENPAMLYSIGKDSSVMLQLARKAFYPSPPPFPLLHVDTRWKFQEMYLMRDYMARESGMELLVHINPEAIAKNINPLDHGSALHTDITKTEGLKQALDKYKFDVVFGGARRDEEKSRAKERIFSFRTQTHQWDPKSQRPELWNLYNARKNKGESIRVFPLSNWTELDIWQYIYREQIPVVPLYFAKERPVVVRGDTILLVDDERLRLLPGEKIETRQIRFRTLGCYPLTGAMESDANTLSDIILELVNARNSERQGRAIDADQSASMEKKKKEGYF
jgi:sulfate adenylyltransferase subunit 2